MSNVLNRPEIKKAIIEMQEKLLPLKGVITKIILFGSTVKDGIDKYNDIDLLMCIENGDYEKLRTNLLEILNSRRPIIENATFSYSNHPRWNIDGCLPFHILLYPDENSLTNKLKLGLKESIEITDLVFNNEGII